MPENFVPGKFRQAEKGRFAVDAMEVHRIIVMVKTPLFLLELMFTLNTY